MENRKNCLQLSENFKISEKYDQNYFPSGSLSPLQESIVYTEDEQVLETFENSLTDDQSNVLNELKIIEYNEMAFPYEYFTDIDFFEFTVNDLNISKESQTLEENYRILYKNYKKLESLYNTSQISIKSQIESSTNTDLQGSQIENLRRENKVLEKLVNDFKAENLENIKEIQDLQKSLKFFKHEVSILKEKTNQQEVLLLKIKLNTENLLDDEGTNKTSRLHELDSYSSILDKLEMVKKIIKLNKSPEKRLFMNYDKGSAVKEISSQAKKRTSIVSNFGVNLYTLENHEKCKTEEEPCTERTKSTSIFNNKNYEKITYKDVLRDLKEITERANKALVKTNMQRKSSCSTISSTPYKVETERYKVLSAHEQLGNEKIRRSNFRK